MHVSADQARVRQDFQVAGAPDFIEWLLPVRERLRQSALEVLATLARAYLNERAYAQAIPILTEVSAPTLSYEVQEQVQNAIKKLEQR